MSENKPLKVSLSSGKAEVVDTGLSDAAVSANGELAIYKPGAVSLTRPTFYVD